jgi:uncharacterized protein (TIRG00374 family)
VSPVSTATETSTPEPQNSSRHRFIFLFSFCLAGVLLYLSFRKVDWRQVWQSIANCNFKLLAIAIAISGVSYFVRGLRWRILLNTKGDLPVSTVFWANSAGYLGNNVLPARAGELIRTAMISSQSDLSKTFVLTTALAERLMDVIVLVVSGSVVLRFVPNKPQWLATASGPLLFFGFGAALAIISIPLFENVALRILRSIRLPESFVQRLENAIGHIADGVRSFHDPSNFSFFLLLTVVIWGLDAYGTTLLASALGMQMSIAVALLLIVGLGMGSALPSTPGYVGIFQFVAVTVLTPFHFTRSDAIAFILVAQGGALIVTGILGSVGLLQYRKLKKGARPDPSSS